MKITFSDFFGTAPKYHDEQLQDGYSVASVNTRAGRQLLEPFKAATVVDTSAHNRIQSLFKYRNEYFTWETPTYAVRAPLKNDAREYVLIAQDGADPQLALAATAESGAGPYPAATYKLGVPQPSGAITVGTPSDKTAWVDELNAMPVEEQPLDDEYDLITTAYAFCYVDALGRLSAMSALSDTVQHKEYKFDCKTEVVITLPSVPSGLLLSFPTYGTTAKIRIYRANFTGTDSILQFVDEVAAHISSYTDGMYSGDLGESPINDYWFAPPSTDTSLFPNGTMRKVCIMGSDIVVGHNNKLLVFAEPEAFYAFPSDYYKVIQHKIVTIVPYGANLAVLTDRYPYVVTGAHPSAMDVVRLGDPVPCMNEFGVTELAGKVYYVGSQGLWQIDGYSLTNVIAPYMTNREWEALTPTTLRLANYNGQLFILSPTGKSYVLDPSNLADGLRELTLNPLGVYQQDVTNDLLYTEDFDNNIYAFDSGTNEMPMRFSSKLYEFNDPMCFPVLKVLAKTYPLDVTVDMYGMDGTLHSYTRTVPSSNFVYLPFQRRGSKWQVHVDTAGGDINTEIRSIQLAQQPLDLE